MLNYGLTDRFVKHVSKLSFEERIDVLWKVQGLLSHVPGYLKLKVSGSDEDIVFKTKETFILMHDDYQNRILADFGSDEKSLTQSSLIYRDSIVNLLSKKELDEENAEIFKHVVEGHFPIWFINLLTLLPKEQRIALMSKEIIEEEPEIEEKVEEAEIKLAPKANDIPIEEIEIKRSHDDVDGSKFEREILRQLAKSYQMHKRDAKPIAKKPLGHVKFSEREVVIEYGSIGQLLFLILKKTARLGCKMEDNDWKLLLTYNVGEYIFRQLQNRFPEHVCYTDEPNKGDLKISFIIKPKKEIKKKEEPEVKKVKSKTASFQTVMPSGAYENIEEEDIPEYAYETSFKPMVQKNVVHVSNAVRIEQVEEQMEDFLDEMFFEDDFDFEELNESQLPLEESPTPSAPKHWHCHICGKKKLYSGEPGETVCLASGKIVYLCLKHRGQL